MRKFLPLEGKLLRMWHRNEKRNSRKEKLFSLTEYRQISVLFQELVSSRIVPLVELQVSTKTLNNNLEVWALEEGD